jgi:hypothetical protein
MPRGASSARGQLGLCDTGASALGLCLGGRSPGICQDGSFVFGYCFTGEQGSGIDLVCELGMNYRNSTAGCDNGQVVASVS